MTYYAKTFQEARAIRDKLREKLPEARVVEYERGYAIQYRKSGRYYPDRPSKFDMTGEWGLQDLKATLKGKAPMAEIEGTLDEFFGLK